MLLSTLLDLAPRNFSQVIGYGFTLWISTLIVLFVKRIHFSNLSHIPGPKIASSSRLWLAYLLQRGDQRFEFVKLHEKYGSVVRIAPNEVSLTTPEAVKAIYGARHKVRKSDWFKVFQGKRKFDVMAERDIPTHQMNRKLVAQAYSTSNLFQLEFKIDKSITMLCDVISSKVNTTWDISHWIQYWSFDTIGLLTFSKPLGYLDHGSDFNGALKCIQNAGTSASWVGQLPKLYDFVSKFWEPIFGSPFALSDRNTKIRELAVAWIDDRKASGTPDKDIFQSLYAIHEKNGEKFDDAALRSMCSTNIFGGAETVSSTTKATLYLILKHPEVKARLIEEIDRVMANHQHEASPGKPVPYSVAQKMEYLQAVMYEAMRYYPANGHPSARVVADEGLTIGDNHFEAGTQLVVYAWSLHQNKDIFGKDADMFNPDRWQGEPEAVAEMQRNFFAFGYGAGPRACMGRHLAWMEIAKIITTLFYNFDIKLADYMSNWSIEGSFVFIQSDINIVAKRRAHTEAVFA